jgi:indolepyruvate ferredoxin oxidoreductase, alpha subunit
MPGLKDMLVKKEAWTDLVMGNHVLVRAMIESGVKVVTTYPGSPTTEIADAIFELDPDKRPFFFQFSLNEKVATEVACGASLNGHLSCVFFKSVGLNVASDSLIQLSLLNLTGGMVVILGDDPGANSSQNEQDNRHYVRMAYAPMMEPANPQEVYEMFLEACKLSRRLMMPVYLRLTTHVCHARQVVQVRECCAERDWTPRFDSNDTTNFVLVGQALLNKARAFSRLKEASEHSDKSPLNPLYRFHPEKPLPGKKLGIISCSIPALSLRENLESIDFQADLLKLGITHPLPRRLILDFLKNHSDVLIVDELDRILESEIKMIAWDHSLPTRIKSKPDHYLSGELGPAETAEILHLAWPDLFHREKAPVREQTVSPRLPQLCAGCGHRSAFYAVKQALPEGAITVAGIGCHLMGNYPPYEIGKVLISMGHEPSTASGLSINNTSRKVVTFIGDSTFFHAGLPAIINGILYKHNVTLVIMDNFTTAMTGHQPNPGSGEVGEKISIQKVLEAFGVSHLKVVEAYKQEELKTAVKEALEFSGFSVVIAQHPCMLKLGKQKRKKMEEKSDHGEKV